MAVVRIGIAGLVGALVMVGAPVLASGDESTQPGTTESPSPSASTSPSASESAVPSPSRSPAVTEQESFSSSTTTAPESEQSAEAACTTPQTAPDTEPKEAGEAMYKRWVWLGEEAGPLGKACGDPFQVHEGYRWNFTAGAIFWSAPTGARDVRGPILARYDWLGSAGGPLGLPVSGQLRASGAAGAKRSLFQHGRIYWSTGTGAREVRGPILRRYAKLRSAAGPLGLPVSGQLRAGGAPGARRSMFQDGRIYWSKGTGAHEVRGPILNRYKRMGSASGSLGLPVSGQLRAGGARGARRSMFQDGRIYWSKGTGAHSVRSPILSRYTNLRSASGRLGLPTGQPYRARGAIRQRFQDGYLVWAFYTHRTYVRVPYFARAYRITAEDVPHTWRSGCPVRPSQLRMMRIVHRRWNGDEVVGRLVVRAFAVDEMRRVFYRAHRAGFPIRRMVPVDRWRGSDVRAMEADNTSAFNCRHVTGNPYRLSQHSYGNAIDINTVENPYVTSSRVYPSGSRTYLNRRWVRKGMIIRGDAVAGRFSREGWLWGARWSNPDYQHFSSNGG